MEESVKSWNSSELLRKLELNIGKDLQYIRINGALVGGIVGLMISTLATFLHQFGFYWYFFLKSCIKFINASTPSIGMALYRLALMPPTALWPLRK